MTLGNKIKTRRLELYLSQEEVAKMVGVSRQSYIAWENNKSKPRTSTKLNCLAAALKVSIDYLKSENEIEKHHYQYFTELEVTDLEKYLESLIEEETRIRKILEILKDQGA